MPIAYTRDRVHNIINESWTGTVTAGELAAYWRTYLTDPEVMRCRRTLVDLVSHSIYGCRAIDADRGDRAARDPE